MHTPTSGTGAAERDEAELWLQRADALYALAEVIPSPASADATTLAAAWQQRAAKLREDAAKAAAPPEE